MTSSPNTGIPLLKIRRTEHGTIRDIRKIVAHVTGLPYCVNGEILDMGDGVRGIVMGYDEEGVLALILGDENRLRMGKEVVGISEPFRVRVGPEFLGRVVDALGHAMDDGLPIEEGASRLVFAPSPPITDRVPVDAALRTGTTVVDVLIPVARGQRQLILGDRITGKTVIAVDAILSQQATGVLCVYCAIGQSYSSLERVMTTLADHGALGHTAVVAAYDSSTAGEQFLAPYCAMTLAEELCESGRDVLVVFDDLTKHAWAYRQLSLLLERSPGREAYPGDIFYVQTQLMERAGRFSAARGGGSITVLGVAETLEGDMTGYIPSNLISMSDGLVAMGGELFRDGARPAVDLSQSFSIVGRRTQSPLLRSLTEGIQASLMAYREVSRLAALQHNLSDAAEQTLRRGKSIIRTLEQDQHAPMSSGLQALMLTALQRGHMDGLDAVSVQRFREGVLGLADSIDAELLSQIESEAMPGEAMQRRLDRVVTAWFEEAA